MVYQYRPKQIGVVMILQSITLCRRTWCVRRSHDEAIAVDVGGLGNENGSARSKLCRNKATLKLVLGFRWIRTESPILPHTCGGCTESHRGLEQIPFFCDYYFIKFMSIIFATENRQAPSERTARWSHGNGAVRLRHGPQKSYSNSHIVSCPIRLDSPEGDRLRQ